MNRKMVRLLAGEWSLRERERESCSKLAYLELCWVAGDDKMRQLVATWSKKR